MYDRLINGENDGNSLQTGFHQPTHAAVHILLGLMALIVSWDHVFFQFQPSNGSKDGQYGAEMWEGPYSDYDGDIGPFLTRSLSHLCSPGFFFLMGLAMGLFSKSRISGLRWTWFHLLLHHLIRGILFILLEFTFDWPEILPKFIDLLHGRKVESIDGKSLSKGDEWRLLEGSFYMQFNLLTGLGMSMIITAIVFPIYSSFKFFPGRWRTLLPFILGWIFFIGSFALSTTAIVATQDSENLVKPPKEFPHIFYVARETSEIAMRFVLFPGLVFMHKEFILYPLFPWVGVTLLGVGFSFLIDDKMNINLFKSVLRGTSLLLIMCFFAIRSFGGDLNFRGISHSEPSQASTFMQVFIQTKYPPDFAFISITLGVDLLLLSMLNNQALLLLETVFEGGDDLDNIEQATREEQRDGYLCACALRKALLPLLIFGRSPVFFYIVSRWIIKVIAAVGRIPSQPIQTVGLIWVIIFWAFILVIMVILCRKFQRFLQSRFAHLMLQSV